MPLNTSISNPRGRGGSRFASHRSSSSPIITITEPDGSSSLQATSPVCEVENPRRQPSSMAGFAHLHISHSDHPSLLTHSHPELQASDFELPIEENSIFQSTQELSEHGQLPTPPQDSHGNVNAISRKLDTFSHSEIHDEQLEHLQAENDKSWEDCWNSLMFTPAPKIIKQNDVEETKHNLKISPMPINPRLFGVKIAGYHEAVQANKTQHCRGAYAFSIIGRPQIQAYPVYEIIDETNGRLHPLHQLQNIASAAVHVLRLFEQNEKNFKEFNMINIASSSHIFVSYAQDLNWEKLGSSMALEPPFYRRFRAFFKPLKDMIESIEKQEVQVQFSKIGSEDNKDIRAAAENIAGEAWSLINAQDEIDYFSIANSKDSSMEFDFQSIAFRCIPVDTEQLGKRMFDELMAKCPKPRSITYHRDYFVTKGVGQCIAFAKYHAEEDAFCAMDRLNNVPIHGSVLKSEFKRMPGGICNVIQSPKPRVARNSMPKEIDFRSLVIRGIPKGLRVNELKEHMQEAGCSIPWGLNFLNRSYNHSYTAFANFLTEEEAFHVIHRMNGLRINDRRLNVEYKRNPVPESWELQVQSSLGQYYWFDSLYLGF